MGAGGVVVLDGAVAGEVVGGRVEFGECLAVVGYLQRLVCEAGLEELGHVHLGCVGEGDALGGEACGFEVVDYVVSVFGVVYVAGVYVAPVGGEYLGVADYGGEGLALSVLRSTGRLPALPPRRGRWTP